MNTPLKAIPDEPTMTLYEILSKLWVTDKEAYYNLRYYVQERDGFIRQLQHVALKA